MEREVILEALPGSKVGQAAELNRGRSSTAGHRHRLSSVDRPWWDIDQPLPPQQKAHFKKELEIHVRKNPAVAQRCEGRWKNKARDTQS